MGSASDFSARGKVIRAEGSFVIFNPSGTNYEIKLDAGEAYIGPLNTQIDCLISVIGRKMWSVPSGGNFISPIFGPPRIVQGRVKYLDEKSAVIQAGVAVQVQLPDSADSVDLNSGPLTVGMMVNVTCLPGAKFRLVMAAAAV